MLRFFHTAVLTVGILLPLYALSGGVDGGTTGTDRKEVELHEIHNSFFSVSSYLTISFRLLERIYRQSKGTALYAFADEGRNVKPLKLIFDNPNGLNVYEMIEKYLGNGLHTEAPEISEYLPQNCFDVIGRTVITKNGCKCLNKSNEERVATHFLRVKKNGKIKDLDYMCFDSKKVLRQVEGKMIARDLVSWMAHELTHRFVENYYQSIGKLESAEYLEVEEKFAISVQKLFYSRFSKWSDEELLSKYFHRLHMLDINSTKLHILTENFFEKINGRAPHKADRDFDLKITFNYEPGEVVEDDDLYRLIEEMKKMSFQQLCYQLSIQARGFIGVDFAGWADHPSYFKQQIHPLTITTPDAIPFFQFLNEEERKVGIVLENAILRLFRDNNICFEDNETLKKKFNTEFKILNDGNLRIRQAISKFF